MSDFIKQCRAEWRRLGVADSLAEEMAADLASDLSEAEAEGISADQLLGPSASDPRSFAFSWAAERGIIPTPTGQEKVRGRPLALVTFTALGAIALIVAALLLLTGQPKVTLTTSGTRPLQLPPGAFSVPLGPGHQVQASAAAPIEWILLFLAIAAVGFAAWLWSRWRRLGPPATAA
jgi:hypothetical protein